MKESTDFERGRPVIENGAFGKRLNGSNWLRMVNALLASKTRCALSITPSMLRLLSTFTMPLPSSCEPVKIWEIHRMLLPWENMVSNQCKMAKFTRIHGVFERFLGLLTHCVRHRNTIGYWLKGAHFLAVVLRSTNRKQTWNNSFFGHHICIVARVQVVGMMGIVTRATNSEQAWNRSCGYAMHARALNVATFVGNTTVIIVCLQKQNKNIPADLLKVRSNISNATKITSFFVHHICNVHIAVGMSGIAVRWFLWCTECTLRTIAMKMTDARNF